MSYVENSFNEINKTFRLKYKLNDGKTYETIYPFYSMFPIGYITEESSNIIPIEINQYGGYSDCTRQANYIPIEEHFRFHIQAKSNSLGWNLPKSSLRIVPNEKITEKEYTYKDINNNLKTIKINVSDYYEKLHLHRNEAVFITDPNHTTAPCTKYELDTIDKLLWDKEPYTENDPPVKPYLKDLVLDENNKTLGISGYAKLLKEKTGVTLTDLAGLGYALTYATWLPKNFIIPEGITSINYLFFSWKLKKLDYPLILPSTLEDISHICWEARELEDFSNFDASNSNISKAIVAFSNCLKLQKLPKLKFKENSRIFLSSMFSECNLITEYPLSTLNIPKTSCVQTGLLFSNNTSLTKIPEGLRNLEESSSYTFNNCISLTEIPNYAKQLFERVDNFKNINKLTSVSYLFNNCININNIDDSIYLPKTINDYSGLFFNCNKLKNIPETFWPTTYETDKINVSNICNGCINLTSNIPGYKLWGNLNILWNSKEAFKNCINISNYEEIPDLWK